MEEFLQQQYHPPKQSAIQLLQNFLKYHLLQPNNTNYIEFLHHLIQKYYASEELLERLTYLNDLQLKEGYLNYVKWTEPLMLMMNLLNDREQVIWVIRLALEVDLRLGARLVGAVADEFQEVAVGLLLKANFPKEYQTANESSLIVPRSLMIRLLGITNSNYAIPILTRDG